MAEKDRITEVVPEIADLAEYLHEVMCTQNHTDMCAYWYESNRPDKWNEWTHKEYYRKAEALYKVLDGDVDKAKAVLDVVGILKHK